MATREDIIAELVAGTKPYKLSKKYPRASVYRIYNELVESGQISQPDVIRAEDMGGESTPGYPFEPATPTPAVQTVVKEEPSPGKTGAEILDFTGPKGLPISAINRIRGVLGITLRPKVLSCPMPELLYPSMVISITELGFQPMRPDDFIDTVLYQWLEACDIIPYAFIKKSELEELAKMYGETEEIIKDEKFRREHGLVTTEEIKEAVLEPLSEKEMEMMDEMENEPPDELEESKELAEEEGVEQAPFLEQIEEDIGVSPEPEIELEPEREEVVKPQVPFSTQSSGIKGNKPQQHKPTVGELLQSLRIENIRKEVEEKGGSTKCTESNSSQGEYEPGE